MDRKYLLGYSESETKIKAHWKVLPLRNMPEVEAVTCSNCIMGYEKEVVKDYKYCPYCGAKIEKPIPDEAKQLIEEERLLDERDGTIAGRGKE